MEKDILQCPYRVNDPLENELTYSEFKRYCEPLQGGFVISPPLDYKKPGGGCRLIQTITTSRSFNRYRGLYTMPTLDDMVQEGFTGMLLYKDDFTGEPKEIIFKAIRKHFKMLYREATAAGRDFDNGRHNARIEPKQKPLKVLIDELDFDPEKEPESVKQANDVRMWRLGGITLLKSEIEKRLNPETGEIKKYMNYKKPKVDEVGDAMVWRTDQGVIHFYNEDNHGGTEFSYKDQAVGDITNPDYIYRDSWPEGRQACAPCTLSDRVHVPMTYDVDPVNRILRKVESRTTITKGQRPCTGKRKYLYWRWREEQAITYRRTQTKTAVNKLKIETEKPFTRKRNDPLELVSLLHAGFFPDYKTENNVKIFFPPTASGTGTVDPAYKQFIIEHIQPPLSGQEYRFQWIKDGYSYFSNMDRRTLLIEILREVLAVIYYMPAPQACITKLYYYQGMTQAEISKLLHKSTRKVQLARESGLESIIQHFYYNYPLIDINGILLRVRKQILNREILPL